MKRDYWYLLALATDCVFKFDSLRAREAFCKPCVSCKAATFAEIDEGHYLVRRVREWLPWKPGVYIGKR